MGPRHTKTAGTRRLSLDRVKEGSRNSFSHELLLMLSCIDWKESALQENTQTDMEMRRVQEPAGSTFSASRPQRWDDKPLERNIELRGVDTRSDTGMLRSEVPAQVISRSKSFVFATPQLLNYQNSINICIA